MPTNFISEEVKEGKASIWSYVHIVTLLKIEGAMFSFIKTPEGITNLPIAIYALLSNKSWTKSGQPKSAQLSLLAYNIKRGSKIWHLSNKMFERM